MASSMCPLSSESLKISQRQLFVPSLQEIKNVVSPALAENFSEVFVEVVDCPDLTQQPFTLAAAVGSSAIQPQPPRREAREFTN
ncbi:ester hydrolase C11orf54 homolog [Diachasma alloeum]|uniref:ester hydrolase C11orf54 homolog n=1 Tax=Diachasma alloeum TaxID=454923 RepID=UPI0007385178|nr:ester hydrolase C11orf54 homolog [Diachasma alloeum]